ncbi:MAG TPA: NAD(P)/FAD-dependent oxidoreductase [Candidatus Gracilibacteria bacterium]|nr:NAD(P)/FAD-dependent oxidoreductase [Candidatus Gracilibacteria bacterium]
MNFRVGIIGGGAAGMMAALAVQEFCQRATVLLFEKNAYLGAKVIISGGGRCNVTTGIKDVRKLLENYPRGAKFLMSAMFRFPPEAVMAWFEDHGVPLKVEEGLRVFPKSDLGKDVVGALEKALQEAGVVVRLNANVTRISHGDAGDAQHGRFLIEDLQGGAEHVDFLIITTGGNAYRHTGSTGDGYAFAKKLGHSITPLGPSLNSFTVAEKWIGEVAGVSFEKIGARLISFDGKRSFERTGPLVFTHRGISGPAIFALSSASAFEQYGSSEPMKLLVNFFPDERPDVLKKRLDEQLEIHSKKLLSNFLDIFLPHSFCQPFVETAGLNATKQVAQLNREERNKMLIFLQAFPLSVVGRGAGDEFVTAGGVVLDEVNTNTMESKICPGLYFAGEILDVDGYTGGFNLQASWAMGRLAGESLGKVVASTSQRE